MFGPHKYEPVVTIGKPNDLSSAKLTRGLRDIMYHHNGTGRDTFIAHNNGGFSIPKVNGNAHQPSTQMFPDVQKRTYISPKAAAAIDT